MEKATTKIKALGEIALPVKNLNLMQEFYENILGLELMKRCKQFFFEVEMS